MTGAFLAAFYALPLGSFTGCYAGRRYRVTRSDFAKGASRKLVASELGGSDYISLNLYRLKTGTRLRPCEMPAAKVIAFVQGLKPDPA